MDNKIIKTFVSESYHLVYEHEGEFRQYSKDYISPAKCVASLKNTPFPPDFSTNRFKMVKNTATVVSEIIDYQIQ